MSQLPSGLESRMLWTFIESLLFNKAMLLTLQSLNWSERRRYHLHAPHLHGRRSSKHLSAPFCPDWREPLPSRLPTATFGALTRNLNLLQGGSHSSSSQSMCAGIPSNPHTSLPCSLSQGCSLEQPEDDHPNSTLTGMSIAPEGQRRMGDHR